MAFRLLWNSKGWDSGNVDPLLMAEDPLEPFRRTFEALGYSFDTIFREDFAGQRAIRQASLGCEDEFRRRIVDSIARRGRPVIAIGVAGPPECCLVTGYDGDGDTLIGWSYFQDMPEFAAGLRFEPAGYFRKRDWYANTFGLMSIGERSSRPSTSDLVRESLSWALKLVRTPMVRDHYSGLAAYASWAETLSMDGEFPIHDSALLHQRFMVHNDAVSTVAEGRWYAAQYLRRVAAQESSMAEQLLAAAACYEKEHDLMWELWEAVGGNGVSEDRVLRLADPEVRRGMVSIILLASELDEEAAGQIERAL
ncbi:MAG TPA: hypothetical protein VHS06_09550 [Chloroflexota bacterium]|nr:hypothetical protein [Chloroflexota bacterium]